MLAATAADPLNVICLFSSVAARTGNAGQSDYAMANEVLNRVANELAKTRAGCVVKSIGWGPWEGGMVTPVLKAKFDEMGVPLIPLASGARHFVAELQQAAPAEVEVVIGGMPQNAPLINPQQAGAAPSTIFDVVVSAGDHLDISSPVPLDAQSIVILEYFSLLQRATRLVVSSGNHDLTGPDEHGEQAALWLEDARTAGEPNDGDTLLVAVAEAAERFGIASLDLSSGRFMVLEVNGEDALASELRRLQPAELLASEDTARRAALRGGNGLRTRPPWEFDPQSATQLLNQQFGTRDLEGFGCAQLGLAIAAAGCLLRYAQETQRGALPHINALVADAREDSVALDAASLRNLEIDTNFSGGDDHTLASVLDTTRTAMGSRWLRRWLRRPLRRLDVLNARQAAIAELHDDARFRAPRELLAAIGDMERIPVSYTHLRAHETVLDIVCRLLLEKKK